MNTLRVKLVHFKDGDRVKDLVPGGHDDGQELLCIKGEGINTYDLARTKENNSFPLFWKAHRNLGYSILFSLCILAFLIFNLFSSCLMMYKVCEYRIECYAYMFPVCFILVITGSTFTMLETLHSKWGSKILFRVENNCAFVCSKDNKKNMVMMMDNDDVKSKVYIQGKPSPITILHCRSCATFSTIKIAAFQLPNETRLHQVVACDVMDHLRPPSSIIGVLVAFYHTNNAWTEECIDDFIDFLDKSGFNVVVHKKNFAIVATNNSRPSSDESSFDLSLPAPV